ncbi:diphthine synthase [Candidatus Woesearchaeota archaeon]|nr:diphthine synthase [Candidatus Woesearchaeota archaeon]
MTLYLIGLGLADQKDISVKGLEIVKSADFIYLENYTSVLQCSKEDLEQFYNQKIILADREFTEQKTKEIIQQAKTKKVAFLVIGDPFSATTHIELFRLAQENNLKVKIINNASVLTAVGITGLQLYKFGKTTSIPFDNNDLETPYQVLKDNLSLGLHTLFLLDLKPEENRFMTLNEAIGILESIELKKKEKIIQDNTLVIGCARLGTDQFKVKVSHLKDVKSVDFGLPPHSLIIPGKLHFMEEEVLKFFK